MDDSFDSDPCIIAIAIEFPHIMFAVFLEQFRNRNRLESKVGGWSHRSQFRGERMI